MATFPTSESEILVLAGEMNVGFTNNPTIYPDPPVPAGSLSALFNAAGAKLNAAIAARAAAEQATADKDAAFANLEQAMKDDLRYAEVTVHMSDEKLKLIGWGAHGEKGGTTPPGQALDLYAAEQGPGWIKLTWKKPKAGGAVAAYRIQRLQSGASEWHDVGMSFELESKLTGQDRGIEFLYQVIASNKAGDGVPSNSVMAVL